MVYWRGAQPPISVLWPQFWLATLGDLSDVLLLNVARLNQASGGMLATLIAARLLAVGFGIEPYADAAAFFEPFVDIIKRAMRKRLN